MDDVLTALPPVPGQALGRRRLLWLTALAAALVSLIAGGGAWFVQWRDHPQALFPYTGTAVLGRVTVGRAVYSDFGLDGPLEKTIQITGIRLHVVTNTADATITLVRFPIRKGQTGIGDTDGDPGWYTENGPAIGSWTLRSPNQLLYAITPHRAGEVVVDGADISYRVGLRHQTQWAGIAVRASATG